MISEGSGTERAPKADASKEGAHSTGTAIALPHCSAPRYRASDTNQAGLPCKRSRRGWVTRHKLSRSSFGDAMNPKLTIEIVSDVV